MVEKSDTWGARKCFSFLLPEVLKCLFSHDLCRYSLPTWRKVIPIYSFLLQSKLFLMYIMFPVYNVTSWPNVEYLKTSEMLKASSNFDICSFVQISRNLGVFCKLKNVLYFGK